MTLHTFPDVEQGTEEWAALRRGVVTASAVGRLLTTRAVGAVEYDCPQCGALSGDPCVSQSITATRTPIKSLHPARTARRGERPPVIEPANTDDSQRITLLLMAERVTGASESTFVSDDMWRGKLCEPIAREAYAKHYERNVTEMGFMRLDEAGWHLGFSPDGMVGSDGLLEIKAPRAKEHIRTILADEVPEQYMPQCQAGLLVSGREWLDFVSFFGGLPLFTKRVYPDPDWFTAIEAACQQFEQTVEAMRAEYERRVVGLPMTEPVEDINFEIKVA